MKGGRDESGTWVTVRVHPALDDAVIAALFEMARRIQEVGETVVTHVASQQQADALERRRLQRAPTPRSDRTACSVDWSEQWKTGIRAQVLGGLTVAPPWLAGDLDPARSIVIEPGMAFGTGEHATTRGVFASCSR
jgi:ribosomal protein L11 methyltransferase